MNLEDEPSADEHGIEVSEGVILRPDTIVLSDDALIPPSNLVDPPSEPLTHMVVIDEPYWYDGQQRDETPSGTLAAGTPVIVLHEEPDQCRVVDGRGLAVDIPPSSVRLKNNSSRRA